MSKRLINRSLINFGDITIVKSNCLYYTDSLTISYLIIYNKTIPYVKVEPHISYSPNQRSSTAHPHSEGGRLSQEVEENFGNKQRSL